MPRLLRAAGCLAAALALLSTALTTTASAASAPPLPHGLFGSSDPTYDGVYRQSLSLIALRTAGYRPGDASLQWLRDQQCPDGGFMAYRASTDTPCTPAKEDTNSTSLAVQALASVGTDKANDEDRAKKAVAWLRDQQRPDGGFPYYPGAASDTNSTGLVLSAFVALDQEPEPAGSGKTPLDFLRSQQVGCSAPRAKQGAFDFQAKGNPQPNTLATTQAILGLLPEALPVEPNGSSTKVPSLQCPVTEPLSAQDSLAAGAGYLARTLGSHGDVVPAATGKGTDFGTTANAVLALAAAGLASEQQNATVDYLREHVNDWARGPDGQDQAGPLATLVLVVYATGGNSRDFGGEDLIQRLQQTEVGGVTSVHVPAPKPADHVNIALIVFVLVAVAVVAALVVLERRRRATARATVTDPGRG